MSLCSVIYALLYSAAVKRLATNISDAARNRDVSQASAHRERTASDAGDAARDRYGSQATAVSESCPTDVGDAVGNRYASQAAAGIERLATDTGDAARNRVATGLSSRALNQRGLAFVEQNTRQIAIGRIVRIHCYRG